MKTLLTILISSAVVAGLAQAGNGPVNDHCPVCGKPARLIYRTTTTKGDRVIFDTSECQEKFQKAPNSFKVTPAPSK